MLQVEMLVVPKRKLEGLTERCIIGLRNSRINDDLFFDKYCYKSLYTEMAENESDAIQDKNQSSDKTKSTMRWKDRKNQQ